MSRWERPGTDPAVRCVEDECRRAIVAYLREADEGGATVDELATHVLECADGQPDPEWVRAELYHVHLPLLVDAGVASYGSDRTVVGYEGDPTVEALLDGPLGES